MKFTCESCGAQYMISDEKVGPSGVKVRCKKCGHVILVRRGATAAAGEGRPSNGNGATTAPSIAMPAVAASASSGASDTAPSLSAPQASGGGAPGAASTPPAGAGLDAELGEAFDHAFGDTPPGTPAPGAPEPAASQDMAATQLMGSEDAAKVFADRAAASGATEWYVAIGQAQVGPLPLPEVKKKWEAGDVGPDSLVWRPGMADWAPLTTVPDLAGYLSPVPRPEARPARAAEPRRAEPAPRADLRAEPTPTPGPEPTWKPVGASALAALASEEIASREAPAPKPAAQRPVQGVKSIVDALPDAGGVDPTGALPLNIKALEATTGEKKIERRSSVARGAAETRHRRSAARAIVIGVVIGAAVVGGAAVGGVYLYRKTMAPPPPSVAAAPAARQPAVPLPPPPMPAAPPAAEASPAPVVAAASPSTPPAEVAPPKEVPKEPAPKAEPKRSANGAKATRGEAPARREPTRKEAPRVASATPTPPPPPPAPASRKKGDLLDFEASDDALDAALGSGGGSPGRSVYVPPARAGGLPEKVSPGDINAAVAQRIDSLRKCVAEQKAREPDASGTLKMRWIIQGDGNVKDVKCLTPQYAQGAFAQCIGGVVKTIKFPRSATTGQEVTFPFNF